MMRLINTSNQVVIRGEDEERRKREELERKLQAEEANRRIKEAIDRTLQAKEVNYQNREELDRKYSNISPNSNQVLREFNPYAAQQVKDFTFNEMKNNIQSDEFKELKRKANNWIPIDAYSKAEDLFNDGNAWDHKSKMKKIISNGITFGKNPEPSANFRSDKNTLHFVTKIDGDKDHAYDHDNWSNMHYGYTMKGAGFGNNEIYFGSRANDFSKSNFKKFPPKINFGSEDIPAVELGIDLYSKHGKGMTREQFEEELRKNRHRLNRYNIR